MCPPALACCLFQSAVKDFATNVLFRLMEIWSSWSTSVTFLQSDRAWFFPTTCSLHEEVP